MVCLHVFRHFSLECPALLILRFSSRISVFRSVHLELNHNSTLPTQFVDGMQRCFLEPGAWWIYQNVSHANISLAGVSGVKKRCQTLGTRTKKNRLSDALIFLYLNRNPFGLISHCSKPSFYVHVAWFTTF